MADRLLLVTSPLLHGADVLAVQKRLHELGFEPGALDGVYGPATERAVRAFQAAAGSRRTASSGRRRGRRSTRPGRQPPAGSAVGRRALAEARRWIGTHEDPPGLEPHPVRRLVRARRRALVQHLRQLLLRRRRRDDDRRRLPRRRLLGPRLRLRPDHRGVAPRHRHVARPCRTEPGRPRDLQLGRRPTRPHRDRRARRRRRDFTAIEGNTSVGNDSDGGEVMRRSARSPTSTASAASHFPNDPRTRLLRTRA